MPRTAVVDKKEESNIEGATKVKFDEPPSQEIKSVEKKAFVDAPKPKIPSGGKMHPLGLGKSLGGKGLSKSLGHAKRHRIPGKDVISGITTPAIKRLMRKGGIKRVSSTCFPVVRAELRSFLERVVEAAAVYTEHAKRKTMTAMDVVYALKRRGQTLYGFEC